MLHNSNPQFAPVAPIQVLEEMVNRKAVFGQYHLFLAHHVVEKDFRFRTLMTDASRMHPYNDFTVIMDNSLVELGHPVEDEVMGEAINIVSTGMTHVVPVLPDAMGDGPTTMGLSEEAYGRWANANSPVGARAPAGFMLVTQGATFYEFRKLVDYFFVTNKDRFRRITWVGVPRKLESVVTRRLAVEYLLAVAPHVNIHLLGFSADIWNDLKAVRVDNKQVKGIDSAVPVRYDGFLTPSTTDQQIGSRGDWWETGKLTPQGIHNINMFRSWLK